MAKLKTHVHVHDENGKTHIFGPKSVVPGWAQKKITNPDAWEEIPEGGLSEAESIPLEGPPGARAGQDSTKTELPPGPPPRSGKGSAKEAWAAYAAEHDLEVPDGASREDIIELLSTHGVPVDPVAE